MIATVDKNDKLALPIQLSERLLSAIESGTFAPGSRLPSGRELAKQFGVSRGTVIEALNILEEKNCIERIAAKGVYVADDIKHELKKIKIIFPFPEIAMSPESFNRLENWSACSDSYHGMLAEAKEQNIELVFQHFEETADERILERQMRSIKDYDGAIFMGGLLHNLRQRMFNAGKVCILLATAHEQSMRPYASSLITTNIKQELAVLAGHLAKRNYERLWIVTRNADSYHSIRSYTEQTEKNDMLFSHAEDIGIQAMRDNLIEIDERQPVDYSKALANIEFSSGKDVIFFNLCDLVVPFYEYCHENQLRIGIDVGVVGYASSVIYQSLVPSMTYVKVNNFAKGQLACRMIIDKIRHNDHEPRIEIVPNELIVGKSTGYIEQPVRAVKQNPRRPHGEKCSKIESTLSTQTEELAVV
jgi:DNA-binding LacI/PurR family transcriptional regulator